MWLIPILFVACGQAPCTALTWFLDADGDGFGSSAVVSYTRPGNASTVPGDCDDTDPSIHPGVAEVCNGLDDNCDGAVDPAGSTGETSWFVDRDGDGWGDPSSVTWNCGSEGLAADPECDDADPSVNPGAVEIWYDGVDQDCDGSDDDADLDGFLLADDCDDANPAVHPGVPETCGNNVDDDCDGTASGCGIEGSGTAASADLSWSWGDDLPTPNAMFLDDLDEDGSWEVVLTNGTYAGVLGLPLDMTSPLSTWTGANLGCCGSVTTTADLDADGWRDIVLTGPYHDDDYTGTAIIVPGGPGSWTDSDRIATIEGDTGATGWIRFGHGMDAADLDADGSDELVVSAPMGGYEGFVYVFAGPVTGALSPFDAETAIVGPDVETYLDAVRVPGDTDGDGFPDLLLGGGGRDASFQGGGHAWLLRGPTFATSLADADLMIEGTLALGQLGGELPPATPDHADLDGDGLADLVIAAGDGVHFFSGNQAGTISDGDAFAIIDDEAFNPYDECRIIPSLQAGGTSDFVCGDHTGLHAKDDGAVRTWTGPFEGSLTGDDATATLVGTTEDDGFGASADGRDLRGDGTGDLLVLAWEIRTLYLFEGGIGL